MVEVGVEGRSRTRLSNASEQLQHQVKRNSVDEEGVERLTEKALAKQ